MVTGERFKLLLKNVENYWSF